MKTLIVNAITIILIWMIGFIGCSLSDSQKETVIEAVIVLAPCVSLEGEEMAQCIKDQAEKVAMEYLEEYYKDNPAVQYLLDQEE